jgi:hypothetical protein
VVPQAKKNEAAKVPAAIDPTAQYNGLIDQLFGYFATKMCAHFRLPDFD